MGIALVMIGLNLSAQTKKLTFKKINGPYSKCVNLPVNLRCVLMDDEIKLMRVDSLVGDVFYGGKDSLSLNNIKVIHLRGVTEVGKWLAGTACFVIATGGLLFGAMAMSGGVVVKDGPPSSSYILPALTYTAVFGSLGILAVSRPKTRFVMKKFEIKVEGRSEK